MADFRFYTPVEIRYADLDPQGHVNNAAFLSYFEQARVKYLIHLGLFKSDLSIMDVGIILADARVAFMVPVLLGMHVRVGVCITRVGTKSMMMEYELVDEATVTQLATGATVLVAFDYHTRKSIPVPDVWREKICKFEDLHGHTGHPAVDVNSH
jgi:acyl-CoA thioester hydrolase